MLILQGFMSVCTWASIQELCLQTGKEWNRNAGKLLKEADPAMQIHQVKEDMVCEGFKF